MPRKRFSDDTVIKIDSLIRRIAEKNRKEDPEYHHRGLTNPQLVQACLDEAKDILRRDTDELVSGYLAARIPIVLPAPSPSERTRFLTLPGLDLPIWLPVPHEEKGGAGWKYQPDLTPNELTKIIAHRELDIEGRIVEKNKLVLLRATALDKECGPDDPISTVFGKDPDAPQPDEGPRPSP